MGSRVVLLGPRESRNRPTESGGWPTGPQVVNWSRGRPSGPEMVKE